MKGRHNCGQDSCNPCLLHYSFEMTKGNELFAVTNAHGSVSTGKDKKVNCTWKQYLIGHPPIEYLWLYEKLSLYNIRKKLKIETINKMYKEV